MNQAGPAIAGPGKQTLCGVLPAQRLTSWEHPVLPGANGKSTGDALAWQQMSFSPRPGVPLST